MSAEAHLGVVHGKVHHTAPELEQQFPRVAVALVLLHRVFHGLFGEAVLQLERSDGQAVDEQAKIERELCLVAAVFELAGDAEPVRSETRGGLWITRRRRAIEEVEMVRTMLDAAAQKVNDAALGDSP